ncbi:DUF3219 family protein [Halalkalibacter wakoensis]|uniref:DUF3219 family protein n=1 Tax=Halalkalibacter wakoensis TaxID=127891 RepID=UPI000559013C|nr:DUF3219 family protein [Halalkalibacter wakoensis]
MVTVIIDDVSIPTTSFQLEQIHSKGNRSFLKISFDFKVRSEDYHRITTLLYKMIFHVVVPEKGLQFEGRIYNYSTSITNLYEENNVGMFHLELMEIE